MRRFFSAIFLILPLLLLADAPQQGVHKNLKVLPQDTDIRATMGAFRTALGQQCTFCHVQGDFASDANPKKEIARHMIQMVNDINAKFPDGKVHVSCYTCHRGANIPLTAPPAQ